jgi:competence protein ComEC
MSAKLSLWIAGERPRLILWSPVMLMMGIGSYFSLDNEPVWWVGSSLLLASLVLVRCVYYSRFRFASIALMLICLGFAASQGRTLMVDTPLLTQELHNRFVEGTIDEIEPVEKKEKLVLSNLVVEGLDKKNTPTRMRISFRQQNALLRVGDRVRFRASVFPLPSQVMPGSYDFARHFYFRNIGGNGFAMRTAEVIQPAQQSGMRVWLNNLRHAIGEDMRASMQGEVGTVAAAMTVGEMGPIPEQTQESLRDSGLSHMLSISGIHLSIVTGIVFYNLRLLLTLYPPLALRLPVKKIACVLALAGAFFYLMLAGMSIPAQRSFITVSFLFLAILLDRRGVTLRTLAISAMIILLLFPEAMLGPSFQMSFAATLAIVSLYERFGAKLYSASDSWPRRVLRHVVGILLTSLVATFATAPFVLYHFNRFALFGLLANMVVVPLATFVMMPGMVIALLLMPLGWQSFGYGILGFGTELMLAMATWVTQFPHASIQLPSPTVYGLLLCTFGMLFLCLIKSKLRLAGLAASSLGLATISQHVPVDVFVSSDAHQVMVRLDSGHYTTLKGTARSFTVQNWLRSEGEEELVPLKESGVDCDKSLCTYQHNNNTVKMLKKPHDEAAFYRACMQPSDVMIAWRILSEKNCPAPHYRIGRDELEQGGAHALYFTNEAIRIVQAKAGSGHRAWHPVAIEETQDEED